MRPHPHYDQALKRLLTQAHDEFLSLIYPDAIWQGELSPELPGVARQADLVWEVEDRGERVALHIELQTQATADIGERVAEYAIRIWRRDHLPIRTIVVYLRPSPTMVMPPFVIMSHGQELMRYDYTNVLLWEIDPAPVLATDHYHLWPLTALMAGVTPDSVAAVAEQIVATPLPRHEQAELTGLLITLAGVRIPKEIIIQLLRSKSVIEDIWKESSAFDAVYEIGHEEGQAEGIAEGQARGKSEGQLTTLRQLAQAAVTGKFPDIGQDVLAHIAASVNHDVLRKLILEIAQFPDQAAVAAALEVE